MGHQAVGNWLHRRLSMLITMDVRRSMKIPYACQPTIDDRRPLLDFLTYIWTPTVGLEDRRRASTTIPRSWLERSPERQSLINSPRQRQLTESVAAGKYMSFSIIMLDVRKLEEPHARIPASHRSRTSRICRSLGRKNNLKEGNAGSQHLISFRTAQSRPGKSTSQHHAFKLSTDSRLRDEAIPSSRLSLGAFLKRRISDSIFAA